MLKTYLNRLAFFDKMGFDRAHGEFKVKTDDDGEESDFLLSLLESGSDYELTTVRNAINFARSWVEIGRPLSQRILTRILYLSFLEPVLLNQLMYITDLIPARGWIYRALSKILTTKLDFFKNSISKDLHIWDFLIDCLLSDAQSKEEEGMKKYCDRNFSFLVEAIPLYWPCEETSRVTIDKLVQNFLDFCIELRSKTSINIINIFCFAFPENTAKTAKEVLYKLSPEALFHLLKLNVIQMPQTDPLHGAIFAAKMLPFNPKLALSLAQSDQSSADKEAVIEMIKHFDAGKHVFI